MAKLPGLTAGNPAPLPNTAQGVGVSGGLKVPLNSAVEGNRRKKIADALSQRGANSSNKLVQYG